MLSAISLELKPFRKRLSLIKVLRRKKPLRLELRQGPFGPVYLGLTGMGPKNAYQAMRELYQTCSPAFIFSVGFVGALRPELKIGDLVLAEACYEITDLDSLTVKKADTLGGNPRNKTLLTETEELLKNNGENTYRGTLITSPEIIGTFSQKKILSQQTLNGGTPIGVEMETAAILKSLKDMGKEQTPLVCLRAVSDTFEEDLEINFSQFYPLAGRTRPFRALKYFCQNPQAARKLRRLIRHSNLAAINLAKVLPLCLEHANQRQF